MARNELTGSEVHVVERFHRIREAIQNQFYDPQALSSAASLLTVAAQLEELDNTVGGVLDEPAKQLIARIDAYGVRNPWGA